MECFNKMHLLAAKRIFHYLQSTASYGLFYRKKEKSKLIDFTNNDYARDQNDRKSTSRYVFMLGSKVVSWYSKKQPIITLSINEAEFVVATLCACQAFWLRSVDTYF